MKGEITNINNDYALVKLPDGRTMNVRIENIKDKTDYGRSVEISSDVIKDEESKLL